MSENCCSSTTERRPACPGCNVSGYTTSRRTVLQHIEQPWDSVVEGDDWAVCETNDCRVMYFSAGQTVINVEQLRELPVFKSSGVGTLCHCFGVDGEAYQAMDVIERAVIRDWVTARTAEKLCSCDVRNPGGRCCLKDFRMLDNK